MAGFTVDYNKASNRHDVPDGEYEVAIQHAAWNMTSNRTEYIQIKLQVRNDVSQAEKGEIIEYPLWKSRPENAKASDISGVPAWRIHQISKAVALPNGEPIDTIDDWFRLIHGKPMKATTKQDDQGRAKVIRIDETMYPNVAVNFVPVEDDGELPF